MRKNLVLGATCMLAFACAQGKKRPDGSLANSPAEASASAGDASQDPFKKAAADLHQAVGLYLATSQNPDPAVKSMAMDIQAKTDPNDPNSGNQLKDDGSHDGDSYLFDQYVVVMKAVKKKHPTWTDEQILGLTGSIILGVAGLGMLAYTFNKANPKGTLARVNTTAPESITSFTQMKRDSTRIALEEEKLAKISEGIIPDTQKTEQLDVTAAESLSASNTHNAKSDQAGQQRIQEQVDLAKKSNAQRRWKLLSNSVRANSGFKIKTINDIQQKTAAMVIETIQDPASPATTQARETLSLAITGSTLSEAEKTTLSNLMQEGTTLATAAHEQVVAKDINPTTKGTLLPEQIATRLNTLFSIDLTQEDLKPIEKTEIAASGTNVSNSEVKSHPLFVKMRALADASPDNPTFGKKKAAGGVLGGAVAVAGSVVGSLASSNILQLASDASAPDDASALNIDPALSTLLDSINRINFFQSRNFFWQNITG